MLTPKPLYCRSNILKFNWGAYQRLIVDLKEKNLVPLPLPLSDLVESCQKFLPLEEHAENWWSHLSFQQKRIALKEMIFFLKKQNETLRLNWNLGKSLAEQVLQNFKSHHLLSSQDEWIKIWESKASENKSSNSISRLVVLTKNRLPLLERALDSYIQNAVDFGDSHDFVVYDDADTIEGQLATKAMLKTLNKKWGKTIAYAGSEEREVFKKALVSEGIDSDLLDFCFWGDKQFGPSYGANRNAFLLDSLGELTISVDDDTLCRLGQSKESDLYSVSNPNQHMLFDFFNSRTEALNSVQVYKGSYSSLHSAVLGKSLPELLLNSCDWKDIQFSDIGPFLYRLLADGRGHIKSSFHGVAGDNASTDPLFLLGYSAEHPVNVLESEDAFKTALRSREVHRRLKKTHLFSMGPCMMMAYGLDVRGILPPFFPLFRQEDSVFGEMTSFIDNESVVAHLPYSIDHLPIEIRNYSEIYFAGQTEFWPFHAIQEGLRSIRTIGTQKQPEDLLRLLGKHFEILGKLPWNEYQNRMKAVYWKSASDNIHYFENLLDQNSTLPDFWKKFILELRERTKKNLDRVPVLAPPTMTSTLGIEKAERKIQEWLFTFGKLIQAWPEILKISSQLKSRGKTLSQKNY